MKTIIPYAEVGGKKPYSVLSTQYSVLRSRRGYVILLVIVCLAILTVMMTAIVRQGLVQQKFLERRENQLQVYWLAQAGIEHAALRLQSDPKDYTGEVLEIVPGSEVRVVVKKAKDRTDTYEITSEAAFPDDDGATAMATRTLQIKRE